MTAGRDPSPDSELLSGDGSRNYPSRRLSFRERGTSERLRSYDLVYWERPLPRGAEKADDVNY